MSESLYFPSEKEGFLTQISMIFYDFEVLFSTKKGASLQETCLME